MLDRLLKLFMLTALVAAFLVVQGHIAVAQLGQGEATAVLDLETGEIIFELGSNIQVFGFESNGPDIFDVSAFDSANAPGSTFQVDPDGIGGLGSAPFPAGVYSLGPVIDESARSIQNFADFTFRYGEAGVPTVTATLGNGVEFAGGLPPSPPVPTPPTPVPPTPVPPTPVPPTPVPPTPQPPTPIAPSSLGQGEATAVLDLVTGEIVLDLGSGLQAIFLSDENSADIFDVSAFDAANTFSPVGRIDPNVITFLSSDPFPSGVFNLGPVLDESVRTIEGVSSFTFGYVGEDFSTIATLGDGVGLAGGVPPVPVPPTPEPPTPVPPTPVPPTPVPPTPPVPSPELPTTPAPIGSLSQGEAQAFLDLETGEVVLDIGSGLQVLGLEAGGEAIFDVSGFTSNTGLGPAQQLDPDGIGFLSLSPISPGTFNLGPIIDEAFLTPEGLANFAFRFGQAGTPALTATLGSGAFFTDPSIPLPEPPVTEPPTPEPPPTEPPVTEPPTTEPPVQPPLPPDSTPFQTQALLDLSTGEVILEVGSGLQVIGLEHVDGDPIFDLSAFDATTGLGLAQQLDPNGIGFLSLSPFSPGTFNLGTIIDPSFRTEQGLAGFQVRFGAAGVPAETFTVANGGVELLTPGLAIPEPGALTLLAAVGLGVVARRRREM